MSGWATVRLIAVRDIRERVRGRALRLSTVISSATVAALIVIPSLDSGDGAAPTFTVTTGPRLDRATRTSITEAAGRLGVVATVRVTPSDDAAEAAVRAGAADIAVVGGSLVVDEPLDPRGGSRESLVSAVSEVLRVRRVLDAERVPPGVADKVLSSEPPRLRAIGRAEADEGAQLAAFIGVAALMAFLQQYGSWVAFGVAEEKQTRIVEVLLSAVRPRDLLAGKVIGVGAVAVGQALVVAAVGLISLQTAGDGIPEGITPSTILAPVAWFILGYAFYCWAFAAAGSLVSRTPEVQSALFPISIPILGSYFLAVSTAVGGDPSTLVRVLAYFPPTAPMLMLTLSANGHADGWQVLISAGITLLSTVVLARVASAIYSRSILRTGKRVRWTEAFRTRAA